MKTTDYIFLAVGCGMFGVIFTYVMLLVCLYFRIDILGNLWLITIPIILAVALNIFLIEVYSRRKKG